MPSIKRKAAPSSGSAQPSKSKTSSTSKKVKTQLQSVEDVIEEDDDDDGDEAAGMLARAMEDDMIDDDDSEDDDEDEDDNDDDEEGESNSDGGFEDLEAGDEPGPSRPIRGTTSTKPSEKSLFKPVTAEEMSLLRREGEERGGSFGFGMKLTALLSSTFLDPLPSSGEVYTPSPASNPTLTAVLTTIHTHLVSLPTLPALSVTSATQRLAPVLVPFPHPAPSPSVKWQLGFEKPKEVFVCGGWNVMGSYRKGKRREDTPKGKGKEVEISSIDLAVVMPETMFTPKDRLSNRYFHKRAHYMAVIASSLENLIESQQANKSSTSTGNSKEKKKTKSKGEASKSTMSEEMQEIWKTVDIKWTYLGQDVRRPILELTVPKNKTHGLKHTTTIRILPSLPAEAEVFAPSQLYPSKSNFRINTDGAADNGEETTLFTPTPMYNTSILLDGLHRYYLLWLHRVHKSCPAFRSALALWRIWGDRRGLSDRSGSGAMGWSWFGAQILGFIIEGGEIGGVGKEKTMNRAKKGLGRGLSEWQLLRAGWEFLASTDFSQTAVYIKTMPGAIRFPAEEFVNVFNNVLVDCSGQINLFAGWNQGEIDLLRHEARNTLNMLSDSVDRFDETFLRSLQSPMIRFDDVFTFDSSSVNYEPEEPMMMVEEPERTRMIANAVCDILRRGLGDRVQLVCVRAESPGSWDLKMPTPTSTSTESTTASTTLTVGLIFDKEQHARILDLGPTSSQEDECREFKEFWGTKSELRRFKDGNIAESVVWNVARPEERARIPGLIVQWLLQRHFGVQTQEMTWCLPSSQSLIQTPSSADQLVNMIGSEKLAFRPILDGFEQLYKALKAEDDNLPLTILNFTAMSPALRYTSTFITHPVDVSRVISSPECLGYIPAADILVQFESSGRWPDDLVAIQKIKLAFMAKLCQVIETTVRGASAEVLLEAGAPDVQDHATLEVLMPSGVAFHLKIYHDRERTLLTRMVSEPEYSSERLRTIAQETYDLHVRRFTSSPRHHAAISTLHHQFPSYATSTRLVKRWLSAHLLMTHIPEEMVELIVADVYINPGSLGVPCSSQSGFLRSLERIASWNWKEEAIIVPLYTVTSGGQSSDPAELRTTDAPSALRTEATKLFESTRKSDPDCMLQTLVVATEEDMAGRAWASTTTTSKKAATPSRLVAGRMVALAKAAVGVVNSYKSEETFQIKSIFEPSFDGYDFVIHLDPSRITRLAQNLHADDEESIVSHWSTFVRNQRKSSGGNGAGAEVERKVRIAFNPVEGLLKDLEVSA